MLTRTRLYIDRLKVGGIPGNGSIKQGVELVEIARLTIQKGQSHRQARSNLWTNGGTMFVVEISADQLGLGFECGGLVNGEPEPLEPSRRIAG